MRKYIYSVLIHFLMSVTMFGQSEYGGFVKMDKIGSFNTQIRTLFQDSKGFIWVGASDGLSRYDGAFIDIFGRNKEDSTSLSDNTINCIIEEPNNYVFWVGTSIGGINRVDIIKNDYQHFYIEPDSSNSYGVVQINSICNIGKDKLLVGTQSQGLYLFDHHARKFTKFENIFESSFQLPQRIHKILKQRNFIWVSTSEGLLQFSHQGEFLKALYFDGRKFAGNPFKKTKSINYVVEKDDDNILFLSDNILYQYNWAQARLEQIFAGDKRYRLSVMCLEEKGGYWIGSEKNGLYYFNPNTGEEVHYRENDGLNTIVNNQITDLKLVQDNKILFVATKNGLSKYDYHKSKFKQFDIQELSDGEISNVFSLIKDSKNTVWLRSQEGFYKKTIKDNVFKLMDFGRDLIVISGVEDDSGNLWFSTTKGLVKYKLEDDSYKIIEVEETGYSFEDLNYLACSSNVIKGKLYSISRVGVSEIDVESEEYQFFPYDSIDSQNLNYRFTDVEYTENGNYLWFSNRRGELRKFNLDTKVFETVQIRPLVNKGLKPCIILDIEINNDGKLWLATYGSGLLIYDPKTNKVSDEMAYDMLDSYVYGILRDKSDNFWISSNKGINRINLNTNKRTSFTQEDGTFCHEFNDRAFYKTKEGNFLFGGLGGFIEFNPDSLYINQYKAKVEISAMLSEQKTVNYDNGLFDEVTYLNDTVLTIRGIKSSLDFYISMLNYSRSYSNKIEWKLEGFEDDWNIGYSYEIIKYNNLKEGKYKLLVKGINHDGVESDNTAVIYLTIKAGFINSLVFKIIVVSIIVLLIYIMFRVRLKWYDRQEKLLVAKVNDKTKALTTANEELEAAKEELFNQKTELEIHRNYLEDIVKVRTADLEAAKQKAEESDRLKTSFLANLSHEIRTPMNAIIGFSSLLQNEEFAEDQKKHFLSVISQSSESLLVLINDIIDISRIETGNIQLINHQTHIPGLIKETLDELVFEDKTEDVRFMQFYELDPEDTIIIVDRYRLKQILSNLLRNAFKFTVEGYVKLTIRSINYAGLMRIGFDLSNVDEYDFHPILFMVEDTGIGIEKENLELIFEPFQKAQNGEKYYKGMGLGLSIVRNLLNLFGGNIRVESTIDKGTTFYFYIDIVSIRKTVQNNNLN